MNRRHKGFGVWLILGLFAARAVAQPPLLWATRWSAETHDRGAWLAADGAGNLYMACEALHVDSNQSDILLIKYNARGAVQWTRLFNGTGNYHDVPSGIAVDHAGNIYVTGASWRGYVFNGGTEYDYLLLKYSPSGSLLWVRYYNGPSSQTTAISDDKAYSIALDSSDNIYLTGFSTAVNPQGSVRYEVATVKYNPEGVQQWARRFHLPLFEGDGGIKVKVDTSGHVYLAGQGTDRITGGRGDAVILLQYDLAGNLNWARTFSASSSLSDFEQPFDLSVDAQGNAYVVGYTWPGAGRRDFFTLKYRPDGTLAWSRIYGRGTDYDDIALSVAVDSTGNVYVAGESDTHDPIDGTDVLLIKYDANGNLQWTRTFEGDRSDFENRPRLALDRRGNVYMGCRADWNDTKYDYSLAKYLPDGTLAFTLRYSAGADTDDLLTDLLIDPMGNLVATGSTYFSSTFSDIITVKYRLAQEGDVNGDGCVDDADLLSVLFAFGQTGSNLQQDLNGDGVVDDADLLTVLFYFGGGC